MAKKWYVIHTYSGYEAKVRDALQQRAKQHTLEDKFAEILIPSETVTEQRPGGKTRVRQKLSLPGYIFVEMEMSETVWHLVKDTPKVTGFIGNQTPQEVPIPQIDILRRGIQESAVKPKPRLSLEVGEEVRVKSKFFAPFTRETHVPTRWYGGDYDDIVVKTDDGWRFAERILEDRPAA